MQGRDQPLPNGAALFELPLVAASERDHESLRISVQTHLRITESIESDMLSHDRHASIKLWGLDHSSLFDYGVRYRGTVDRTRIPQLWAPDMVPLIDSGHC